MSGYIYSAESVNNSGDTINVPYAVTSREKVTVSGYEFIEDAYDEIIKSEENSLIRITRYEQLSEAKLKWIADTMKREYEKASEHPEYRYFIENKFGIGAIKL